MKRTNSLVWLLLLVLLLGTGCAAVQTGANRYETSYLDLFDTVTSLVGYADSRADFEQTSQLVYEELLTYHQLFDIYHDYPGVNNLKTVNDQAGIAPVAVDRKVLDLLLFCREMEQATDGLVNPAMGSVLSLWHEARTRGLKNPAQASLPDPTALEQAALHVDFDAVIIDETASTVYLSDPMMRLDVGAVAKGYAVEQVCRLLPAGYLLSVGGNVCGTGPKPDGGSWVIGLQDPDGNGNLHTVQVARTAVVTSGDYQRYYTVDGVRYHHIIDPQTRMPAARWQAVSIVCEDSAVADVLSTALFLLDQQAGQALLKRFDAEAMWLDSDGNEWLSSGFGDYLKS